MPNFKKQQEEMQPWMGRERKVSVKVISTEERSEVTQRPGQRVEGEAAAHQSQKPAE